MSRIERWLISIIKTLIKAIKAEQEPFRVPRSAQDAIPIRRVWPDGIFQVGSRFSKTFSFTDVNYQIAGKEDKLSMFLDYSELLNALDSGASAKITVRSRRVNRAEFEQSLLLSMKEDGLDRFREEYNEMLLSKGIGANGMMQDRLITITVAKRNIEEARIFCPGRYRPHHPLLPPLLLLPGAGRRCAVTDLPGFLPGGTDPLSLRPERAYTTGPQLHRLALPRFYGVLPRSFPRQ